MAKTLEEQTPDYRPDSSEPVAMDAIESGEEVIAQVFGMGLSDAGRRLDVVLTERLPDLSRTRVQAMIDAGQVLVDGEPVTPRRLVRGDEHVAVTLLPRAQDRPVAPEFRALPIVFEDNHLLVIDKPAGWVVHPGAGNWSGTLQNFLLAHHPGAQHLARGGIVHRLDKDTSGLMVVAKTESAQLALVRMISQRKVRREYLAVVRGIRREAGTVNAPIGRDTRDRTRMAIVDEARGGRAAVTHFQPRAYGPRHTLVRCQLETGRTHQIRVHMAHLCHPIEGDPVYAARPAPVDAQAVACLARQALHATHLSFSHPVTSAAVAFESPMPADMTALCLALELASAA